MILLAQWQRVPTMIILTPWLAKLPKITPPGNVRKCEVPSPTPLTIVTGLSNKQFLITA